MKSNPVLRKAEKEHSLSFAEDTMTLKGTKTKIIQLTILLILSCIGSWIFLPQNVIHAVSIIAFIFMTILAFTMYNHPERAKTFSIIYALLEGITLAGVSRIAETYVSGIVFQSAILTVLAVLVTLGLHTKYPTVASKIRTGIIAAMLAICATYLIGLLFTLFGLPFIFFGSGLIGIGFSLFCVSIAIANLMVDYDTIDRCINTGAPKEYEWLCAFGILVTIVWIYLEILDVLLKIASRSTD